jgi:glycosyltransferase involved in cell wall biosynthesis
MEKVITLNFIQDVATPHNNTLLKALKESKLVNLKVWYAWLTHPHYTFGPELASAIEKPIIYGYKYPSLNLLWYAIRKQDEKFFVVGWANWTTHFLFILFFVIRRPYNMWFDLPTSINGNILKKIKRELYYFLLKHSKVKVFCIGKNVIEFFMKKGFKNERLINLPIFINVDKEPDEYLVYRKSIKDKYSIKNDDLFITAGSRLIYEKGFDVLVNAVCNLENTIRKKIKVLIVGKGAEKSKLLKIIENNNLQKQIFIEEWMNEHDFRAHMAASDICVHPARFDAFGGGTLIAMAVGVPVIGTYQAGSAIDRIEFGKNGYLYNAEDCDELIRLIKIVFEKRESLVRMKQEAWNTAKKWMPNEGALIISKNII